MSLEITDWVGVGSLAMAFLAYIEAKKSNSGSQEALEALTVVIEASEKTHTYLLKRKGGAERDRGLEYDLAELWANASFIIGSINDELSARLSTKSTFWRNQDTWSGDMRATKDISLEYVNAKALELRKLYA